jgi:hypothetical protein
MGEIRGLCGKRRLLFPHCLLSSRLFPLEKRGQSGRKGHRLFGDQPKPLRCGITLSSLCLRDYLLPMSHPVRLRIGCGLVRA